MVKTTPTPPQPSDRDRARKWVNGFIFVITIWLLSRLTIVMAMQIIAPLIDHVSVNHDALPEGALIHLTGIPNWELFSYWDGKWYEKIATSGYTYANDGQQHSVAFFPLFPLIARITMQLGLPFKVAATFVNNLAFLGALLMLYGWTAERHGINSARWAIAVLAWCPFSLYGTVIYTEGLFLLLTTAALRAFDNRQHTQAALWGALATATRATGVTLIPTFLLVAWKERRPPLAYFASLTTSLGLLLFFVYCGIRFGEPFALFRVQSAWEQPTWLDIFRNALRGSKDPLVKVLMVFGGGYLLWHLRKNLSLTALAYGFFSLAMIITSGALASVGRYAYGIVSLSLAFGVLLALHKRLGYAVLGLFAATLAWYAIRFARGEWVS